MILIDAVYIWQAGGRNLLNLLINQFEETPPRGNLTFLIDERIRINYINRKFNNIKIEFLKGNEFSRYKYYFENRYKIRKVLCFANIPVPIRLDCEVAVYFQNILYFDKELQKYFSIWKRFMFKLKGAIIKRRLKNTNNWIVQTKHVKDLLLRKTGIVFEQIEIIPFYNDDPQEKPTEFILKDSVFFYPATGAAHKNHDRLLQAWKNLYQEGKIKHTLHLTIDERTSKGLYARINKLKKEGVPIINHGYLSKSDIETLYAKSKFVIHPSLGESFGLVLIEAIRSGCILLAPDLPYVHSIVQPNYLFDARQINTIEESIIQAIKEEDFTASKILVNNEMVKLVNNIIN